MQAAGLVSTITLPDSRLIRLESVTAWERRPAPALRASARMPISDRLAGNVPRWKRRVLFLGRLATVASGIVAVGLLAPILLEAGRPSERAVGSRSAEGWPDVNPVGPKPEARSAADQPAGVSEQSPGGRPGELANWIPERRVPGSAPIVGSSPVRPDPTSNAEPPVVLLPAGKRPSDIAATVSDQDLQRLKQESVHATGPASNAGDGPPGVPAPSASPNEVDASAQADTTAAPGSDPGSGMPATTAALPARSERPDASGDREGKRRSKAAAAAAPQTETQEARSRDRKRRTDPEKPALERQASAGRTRNPATQPQAVAAPTAPPASAPAAPDGERVRLLGIPLPTGSEVRQCLLEFRC
jgi:hypothetical protein